MKTMHPSFLQRSFSSGVLLVACAMLPDCAQGQQYPCGLSTMSESSRPLYPAIAKAAHAQGVVVLLVSFKTSGEVDTISVVAGHEMLRESAIAFVRGWHANSFTGPRTCPIAIDYHLQKPGDRQAPIFVRKDVQHGTVNSGIPLIEPSHALAMP
jgi:TonB family protein